MSVCDGARVLAEAGLLDGKSATTMHGGGYHIFMATYPKVAMIRGVRLRRGRPARHIRQTGDWCRDHFMATPDRLIGA